MPTLDRRSFLTQGAATAAGAAVAGTTLFQTLGSATATASPSGRHAASPNRLGDGGYGPLARVPDQNGDEILALPDGFQYVTFSKIGELMSDGTPVPVAHDGMGAFGVRGRRSLLIRNHEVRTAPGTVAGSAQAPAAAKYDELGVGGTTTLVFNHRRGELERHFVSFAGSIVNCAGGIAYQRAGWITCEETVAGPAQGWTRKHGYAFLVSVDAGRPEASPALTAMGRFAHEAVAVDPRTGIVYQTEDDGNDSGLYRFLPNDPRDLTAGGALEMLAVAGQPQRSMLTGQQVGLSLPVQWVPIADPDPDLEGGATPVALQGIARGGALFNRLEGIWYDRATRGFYFNSTSGGNAAMGQVWHYSPRSETLTLFFESPGGSVLDSPDNLLVTPRGGVLLCEDDASGADNDTHPLAPGVEDVNRLIGINPAGEAFEFAVNVFNDAELAGATFSDDGEVLFVNIFGDGTPGSGMTCAITGPWGRGAL
ncbi:MAG TPA: alkaline phosphatase PhoX [Acidimicrobiales bacterium]|nr:alkaline phosphatase PhoX [Acidimicrobiales bacterium]